MVPFHSVSSSEGPRRIDRPTSISDVSWELKSSCFLSFLRSLIVSGQRRRPCRQSSDASVVRLQFRRPSSPQAVSWQGAQKTAESHGGQFPSHPGRPGPETSSEGAHLTPNPQEIQAGFSPPPPSSNPPISSSPSRHPSLHPSLLLLGGRKAL